MRRDNLLVLLDLEETFTEQHCQLLLNRLELVLNDYDFVLYSDYYKGSLCLIQQMVQVAKKAGKTFLIDPKSSDLSLYRGAHYITPNLN
ncbi:bifunctional heptose 7-phosphate kinase/heptose 1-phosphate adenyltransferase, partial [Pseudoalteromonas sp. S1649]